MPGNTSPAKVPSTGARANKTSPPAASSRPAAIGRLIPNRITSFADRPSEKTAMIKLAGRKARPTCSGL